VAYTLSKADSTLNDNSIFGSAPTNPFDLDVDKGPDGTDMRHNLVLNGAAAFPYGFQLSGIWISRSARPWSPWTYDNPIFWEMFNTFSWQKLLRLRQPVGVTHPRDADGGA
jgi:hypothetical protein